MTDATPYRRFVAAALCAAMLLTLAAAPAPGKDDKDKEDRYWAIFRDLSIKTDKQVHDWHHDRGNPHIRGQRFFDDKKPLLLLRDTTVHVRQHGAWLEMANGDVLPGRVLRSEPASAESGMPDRLIVSVQGPLSVWDEFGGELPVRPDRVSRIVFSGPGDGPVEPGTLLFHDGRKVKVQQVRFTESGVKALTDQSIVRATWNELSEVHPPDIDVIAAVREDATAPCPDPDSLIGRIVTSNGGVLTYRRAMLRVDRDRWRNKDTTFHIVQPAWALAALRMPFDEIAMRSYRRADEVPLSVLPAQTLSQSSFTGFVWPWRRNANVRGAELNVGQVVADLGVGTHSHSEVAFDLPPRADAFYTWIGVDRAVGNGGCVRCSIHQDSPRGKRLWQSNFLRGGSDPIRVGPIDVKGVKRLVLVTEFGHDGRPGGADPVDIRDEVDWLWPTIDINLTETRKDPKLQADPVALVPQFADWKADKELLSRVRTNLFWDKEHGQWRYTLSPNADKNHIKHAKPYEMKRRVRVSMANAWFSLSAARDDAGDAGHTIELLVNGEKHETIMNGDIHTHRRPGDFEKRYYSLGKWADQDVELTLRVTPRGSDNHRPSGLLWGPIRFEPIVRNLPPDGRPIQPDVPLTSLEPVKIESRRKKEEIKIQAGKLTKDDQPLTVRDYPMPVGFGVHEDTKLTYNLTPSMKRFVAVIGLADGGEVGPYELHLDGEFYWRSGDPEEERRGRGDSWDNGKFDRDKTGEQIDVEIPPGHKTITLILKQRGSDYAAWGYAGFMRR